MNMTARPFAAVVLILTALATVSLPAPVTAQDETATLTVHVTGAGGLPLAGADVAVTAAEADAAEAEEATTDATGNASFELAPGVYTVTVSATGHETATEDATVAENMTLEVALEATRVTPPVATGTLVVEVVHGNTGEPVDEARVSIRFTDRDERDSQRTGEDGIARFEDLVYGRGEITVTKSGFEESAEKFTLASEEQRVALKLQPEAAEGDATVVVTVVDQDGDPIEGADVNGNTWTQSTSGYDADKTDEDGKATLTLPAGQGGVSANHPQYYGGYANFDATDGDAEVEVVMQEKPKPDATLTGTVVDGDGDPVEGAQVWIHVDYRGYEMRAAESGSGSSDRMVAPYYCCPDAVQATTDEDGRFEAKVYSGDLNIQTTAKGYAGQNDRASVDEGDSEDIEITLEKAPPRDAVVRGRVVDADTGLPVANAGVNVNNLAWSDYGYAMTDATGAFEITTFPGYAQINVWPSYGPVCMAAAEPVATDPVADTDEAEDTAASPPSDGETSAEGGASEPASDGDVAKSSIMPCLDQESDKPPKQYYTFVTQLVLESGSNDLPVRLEPKPEPATELVGYVLDGDEGIPGAWINVRNEDTGEWGNAQTDKDGSYKIMVRPGHLVLDASADGFYPRSITLNVGDDDRVRQDVDLVKGTMRWVPCDEDCYRTYGGGYAVAEKGYAYDAAGSGTAGAPGATPPQMAGDGDDARASEEAALSSGGASAFTAGPKTGPGANSFVGGGGGLGPYSASTVGPSDRNPAPGIGLVALVAAGALVALAARRR